jgi:hypothetical protein
VRDTFPLEGRYNPEETSVINANEGALTLPEGIVTFDPIRIRSIPAVAKDTFPLEERYNPLDTSVANASEGAPTVPFCMLLTLPASPAGPWIPPYERSLHAVVPFPILNCDVFVSIPISPAASVGFVFDHSAAVPLRNCS